MENYNIKRVIGSGSLGTVYEMIKDGKIYAVKKITDPGDETFAKLNLDLMKTCDFINVVKIFDVIKHLWSIYLVMEMCGINLRHVMELSKAGKLKLPVIKVFVQLADGLKYLHDMKFIHGNLKPENIFVNRQFEVKIGDFGLKNLINTSNMDATTTTDWTYFSPEIVTSSDVDGKTDVWSLGLIMYEMIMKKLPFKDSSFFPIGAAGIVDLEQIPQTSCDPRISSIIYRMLMKDPKDRPGSAEIVKELDRMLLHPRGV